MSVINQPSQGEIQPGGSLNLRVSVQAPHIKEAQRRAHALGAGLLIAGVLKVALFVPEVFLYDGARLWSNGVEALSSAVLLLVFAWIAQGISTSLGQPVDISIDAQGINPLHKE